MHPKYSKDQIQNMLTACNNDRAHCDQQNSERQIKLECQAVIIFGKITYDLDTSVCNEHDPDQRAEQL